MTTVLITGANRGIGLALVREYAADGAEVIACCRDPANADTLKQLATSSAVRVRILQLDVADEASIASLGRAVGTEPIDILINNAAIIGPKDQSTDCIDAEGWMTTLRVNALGPMLIAQTLRGNLKRGRDKKLVAISSNWGSNGMNWGGDKPGRNRIAYRTSKAALNNGMHALSRDWAVDGIIVGIFHPGSVRTDMNVPSAPMSPEESARALKNTIAELTPATNGAFKDYRGEAIPW